MDIHLEVSEGEESARGACASRLWRDLDVESIDGNCCPALGFHSPQRVWKHYLKVLWAPWEGAWKLKEGQELYDYLGQVRRQSISEELEDNCRIWVKGPLLPEGLRSSWRDWGETNCSPSHQGQKPPSWVCASVGLAPMQERLLEFCALATLLAWTQSWLCSHAGLPGSHLDLVVSVTRYRICSVLEDTNLAF